MSTALTPQDVQDAYDTQLAAWVSFAALIFILYELVLALPAELEYIWTTPRSFTKAVYLSIRYYTIITLLGLMFFGLRLGDALHVERERYCRGWLMYLGLSLHISATLLEIVLILRVYALYNRSRRLGRTLGVLFIAEQVVMLVCLFLGLQGMKPDAGCLPTATPPVAIGYGLAPIFFEAVLLGLSLHKWYTGLRQGWGRVRAFRIFMRDGVWAFAVVFVAYALNGGVLVLVKGPTNGMLVPWQYAAASFAACRLVLHMQRESRGKRGFGSSRSRLGTTEEGNTTTSGVGSSGMALTTIVLDDDYVFGADGQLESGGDALQMQDIYQREGIR